MWSAISQLKNQKHMVNTFIVSVRSKTWVTSGPTSFVLEPLRLLPAISILAAMREKKSSFLEISYVFLIMNYSKQNQILTTSFDMTFSF